MEGGDICRASSSLRTNSSSIWRNNGVEIFSRSSRGEDDEEALKWAAIEKLPTFNRLKKGLLKESLGVANEVDVQNLGFQERKDLIERLVSIADEDNEKLLLKLKNRIDRVGIEMPRIEVKFERLKVEAEAYVGSRALPTFFNFSVNILEGFLNYLHMLPSRKKQLSILNDVSGIIKPCRMTLLLGPPSSGKTTLLLALAGKLDTDLKVSGRVTFNGHEMHEFVPQRTAAYISQHDLHIGEMTVRETLAFSARCQGVGSRYEMLAELSRREKAANIKPDPDIDIFMKAIATEGQEASVVTDYILKVLGLEGCADTMVGDGMIRGISGGQRKRVTTGEMLVGPAKALFMDEISTGLDSSTTFQIVKSLRQYVHILEGTTLISLLQPAPETYDLFDDIILLSDGQIVYQGPREHVLGFFEQMGFKCPERKGVADFLQEVTSKKDQRQYWACKDEPYSFVAVNEFAEAFKSFHVGQMLGDEIAAPFDKTQSHPAALTTRKYGISKKELLKACTSRELLLMKRNSFVYIFKLMQVTVMALITMTLFLRTEMHRNSVTDGGIYTGAMFFTVIMIMFNGLSEISMTIAKLPVFHKQRDLLLYPPWAYAFPTWLLKVPVSCVEVAFWVLFTYYTIGYDPNVGRLFRQYLLLLLVNQMASALFRFIGAAGRNMIVANTFGSFALLMLFALGGFILSRENVKKWWIWGYWMSPLMYGQNAILVNEFLGNSWRHVLKNETESLGVVVLKSRGFFPDAYWYWLGVGALLGFLFLFNFCFTLALTYLNPFGRSQTVIPEESQSNANDDRSGESIQLSSRANSSVGRTVSKERGDQIRRRNITSESSSARTIANVDANKNRKKGMILPFEQHSISFDEIKYSVDMPQEMKEQGVVEDKLMLLKGVSGAFRPGVLTALMGVSGAGKTTLMDVLAGRKTGGYIEGNITVSGYPKKQETFARISGYCEQNDIHSPHVTIYESLLYSAWLRLPPEVNSETRKMFIEEVMELVELTSLRDALVGLPGVSGLSTEQRKRLTIAVELVANPSIIFMDEPTSGLDARAAAIVMRTVRNTVDTGRTVVCTIHQPSIDIFEAFDELFLMKRGGQEIYVGPLGRRSCHLIKYFEGIEGVSKIKDGYNPAAWMLEITASAQELILGVGFAEVYKSSELYRRNKALITELSTPCPGSKDLYFPTQYSKSFFTQCTACLWKQHWSYWRNPPYTAVRFLFTTFIALVFGTLFWNLGSKRTTQQDLFNAMGSMYTAVLFLGIQNASSVQPVVAVERTVFYRERAAGMYSAMPYAFAQVIIELPHIFAQAIVYGVIVYAMIGFEWTVAKLFWYLFFMYFTLLYFTLYGMMTVAVTPNNNIAAIIASAFYAIWNIFSGFVVPLSRIPIWWRWYYWACPVAWTLYGLVASQFGDIEDTLDTNETVKDFLRNYFGFRHDFVVVAATVVVGFTVLFTFIFAFSIKAFNFQRR
ncbi:pleiotropic drug resistance protein 1-like [Camellia sinensis]|uniref:pleiotropic drug resistance protein 1-like n=1 Tax=Camellia sinensis TaxID=4442 RepID=UPI001036F009|nr:pleiotropic drug resistance protein 1-like [Camellia sinensis]